MALPDDGTVDSIAAASLHTGLASDKLAQARATRLDAYAPGAAIGARKLSVAREHAMTGETADFRLVVKHRYCHTDPVDGSRISTRHHMTAAAAAASEMLDAEAIADSREERYVAENPNAMP